jgi:6,7-dimethyl-8-ribityllumazine synthase
VGAVAAEGKVAIANGVLACNTLEQAEVRAAVGPGNRGAEAATVAVEMADVYARLGAGKAGG